MTSKKQNPNLQMNRITDMIFYDLQQTNDDEILAEATEDGIDIDKETKRIKAIISEAAFASGKARLAEAKKAFIERKKSEKQNPFHALTLQKKKQIINSLKNCPNLKEKKITLAARNENELLESDIEVYLKNLYDLKVIDEEGNALCD